MMWWLLIILLPLTLAYGCYIGFKYAQDKQAAAEEDTYGQIPKDYFVGLNYLINEQPDKAVDVFIKVLEVNTDTVDMHLTLGNLFRKRGELDRAIRIHQNLIARPQLDQEQRIKALSELAQDYLHSGWLDRAERILLELIEFNKENTANYRQLLYIYEQQKDWRQALEIANQLAFSNVAEMQMRIAHYYCELAEEANANGRVEQVQENLHKALAHDKNCVRANILLGRLLAQSEQYKAAIKCYKQVKEQDPDYLSEVIAPIAGCYEKLGMEDEFIKYFESYLKEHPRISLTLTLFERIKKQKGAVVAMDFLTEQVNNTLSLRGLRRLLDLYMADADLNTKNRLALLQRFVDKLLESKPIYRCVNCGFAGKHLYWQCPSCKRWSTVKPIHGLEGD
jgi:lipopolysaccharide assembly protein B